MLELRPNCEYCETPLPPDSREARICTYECTFCADCAERVLENVCPNCGGGFERRPIRPRTAWRDGVSLTHQPAGTRKVALKHPREALPAHIARIRDIPPEER